MQEQVLSRFVGVDSAEVMQILSSRRLQETEMTLLTLRHRAMQKDFFHAATESHAFRCGEMTAELNELKAKSQRSERSEPSELQRQSERRCEEIKKSLERSEVHCREAGNLEQWL